MLGDNPRIPGRLEESNSGEGATCKYNMRKVCEWLTK